jgi:hypothetical protein
MVSQVTRYHYPLWFGGVNTGLLPIVAPPCKKETPEQSSGAVWRTS